MSKKKNTWVKKRHGVIFAVLRCLVAPILRIMYGYKIKKYKLEKNQGYFIISNHQSLLDPAFVAMSFKRPVYFVSTDNLFTHKTVTKVLKYAVAPIPKRKGTMDSGCIKNCLKIAKENGTIGLFVEGNRAYADFQFYIDPSISKLIKKMNLPVVLFNLKGGYGVDPRWGKKKRKGPFTGEIKRILSIEEINTLSNDELHQVIKDEIRVMDSESNQLYKSNEKAEYLEREFFVCPKCKRMQTIYSKGNKAYCSHCDFEVEYFEDLHIKTNDSKHDFKKLVEWYQFQLDFIKEYKVKEGTIFEDEDIEIYYSRTYQPRELISKGKLIFTPEYLQVGEYTINIKDIISASPVGGVKLVITTNDDSYFIKGHEKFNPLKFVLFLNILEGPIKESQGDKYYDLSIYNL